MEKISSQKKKKQKQKQKQKNNNNKTTTAHICGSQDSGYFLTSVLVLQLLLGACAGLC